jgi:Na+/proline symporter
VIAFTGYAYVGIKLFAAEFLPATFSPDAYAVAIIAVTTLYTVVGGLYSVVLTDMIQFLIMIVCSIALGLIAMSQVSPESLASVVPAGWTDISFGWLLGLDWSELNSGVDKKIESDGFELFTVFMMMMVFKGVLVSAAGPAPNYDMQRVLAAKSPREAAMMSGLVTVVLFVPRYFMIAGLAVLALVLLKGHIATASDTEFERLLPVVTRDFVPIGLKGLLIAGLLAAFMSTFSGTINAAAAYLVNDVYKRYLRPEASERECIRASYLSSLLVVLVGCGAGVFIPSVNAATAWIVSALWSGYAAPNILKWHWWRFNGWGYFYGMIAGIAGALALLALPFAVQPLHAFPILMLMSAVGAVAGSLLSRPESNEVLVRFYTRTRPWGWWGPIQAAALRDDPAFQPNREFGWDMFNVLIGIVWQTAFVALPIYVVIQMWREAGYCLAIIVVTSMILKRTWYDRLEVA